MATQMGKFGLVFEQVTGSAPGHASDSVQLYASSSSDESGTTQLFMKDSAGTEVPIGGSFKLEDGDGTELAISGGAQLKFVEGNGGVDINWSDTSHGVDGDEYDLSFTLDLNGVGAAAIDVANDSIAFIDAGSSHVTKKESIADLVGFIAGTVTSTGLSDSSGVLSLDINNLTGESTPADADLLAVYDADAGALRKMTRAEFIEGAALDAINIDGGAIDGAVIGANNAAAGTFTSLVAGGNVDLGDAASDTVTVNGQFDSDLVPSTDSARDLGSSSKQWAELHVDVGHIDQLGSALDANNQAITNINVDGGAIDGTVIGANSAAAGTFAAIVGTSAVVNGNAAVSGTLHATGNSQLQGTLEVVGAASFEAAITAQDDLSVTGKLSGSNGLALTGDALFNDSVTLGNGAADVVTVTGKLTGSNGMHMTGDSSVENMLVRGELQVQGAINTVANHETELHIEDKIILIASGTSKNDGALALGALDGGGIYLGSTGSLAVASLRWDAQEDRWHTDESLHVSGALLVGGASSLNGAVTLGDATGDDITITGRIAADIDPKADNTYDLGAASLQWKDLYVNGIGYIDQLGTDADPSAAYISSGEIDGTVIGGESAAAGTFTDLVAGGNVDLGDATSDTITATGRFDSDLVPSTDSARALGTSALQWSAVHVDVGHIDQLGSALDANDQAITNINVDGGAIDGTVIGANSAAAGTFAAIVGTSAVVNGNAAVSGTLHATGQAQLQGGLEVKNAASFEGDVTVYGDLTGSGGLEVTGDALFKDAVTIGQGAAEDTRLVFDGNAADFYMGLDDTDDKLKIGLGSAVGTTPNMTLNSATRDVIFHGDIQVAGNQIADSGFSGANPVISFDGSQNTTLLGTLSAGGGYAAGGYALTTGGAFSAAGNMIVGVQNTGASFTAFGPDAGSSMQWNGASGSLLFKYGTGGGNEIMNVGALASSDFAIDVRDGANNVNKIRAAAFVTYSDESLKSEVKAMDTALDTVMSLEGVEFTWKNSGERDFGFIAQDVQKVVPKAVHTAKDGVQGVDYSRLTSILVEAVKSQQVQIEELKNTISKLKK